MTELLTATPTPEALRAKPMTAAEIDAHPDHAKIWATVMLLRQPYAGKSIEDSYYVR